MILFYYNMHNSNLQGMLWNENNERLAVTNESERVTLHPPSPNYLLAVYPNQIVTIYSNFN